MTDPITRSEVLAAQALATDAPGPACDAVRSLAATLLEAIDKLKVITLSWQCSHSLDVKESECAKCKAVAFLRKFEGGE